MTCDKIRIYTDDLRIFMRDSTHRAHLAERMIGKLKTHRTTEIIVPAGRIGEYMHPKLAKNRKVLLEFLRGISPEHRQLIKEDIEVKTPRVRFGSVGYEANLYGLNIVQMDSTIISGFSFGIPLHPLLGLVVHAPHTRQSHEYRSTIVINGEDVPTIAKINSVDFFSQFCNWLNYLSGSSKPLFSGALIDGLE